MIGPHSSSYLVQQHKDVHVLLTLSNVSLYCYMLSNFYLSDDLYSPLDINAMSEIPELIGRVSDIY